jgi:3'(2'), 5'-bisphosphate nucleotidase
MSFCQNPLAALTDGLLPMHTEFAKELAAALEAARQAGEVILGHYASFTKIEDAPIDISTVADRESQEAILTHLHATFPGDALCAEEATPTLAGKERVGPRLWIIDPIDGSRGFAKKLGEFSVMIAFVQRGTVMVGVVAEPAKGRLTWAVRGAGCWAEDAGRPRERCQVGTTEDPQAAALIQSHSKPGRPSGPAEALCPARVIETYSAGVKLARVARGEADVYVNTYVEFHDWDIAAGHILVEEAGGRATGLGGETLRYGEPGAWQRHGLIAANPVLLENCLPLLRGR